MSTPKSQQTQMKQKDSLIQEVISSMRLLVVPFMVAFLVIRSLPLLVKLVLVKLIFPLLLSRTFWTLILMGIVSILILKQQSPKDYLHLVELIKRDLLLSMSLQQKSFVLRHLRLLIYTLRQKKRIVNPVCSCWILLVCCQQRKK